MFMKSKKLFDLFFETTKLLNATGSSFNRITVNSAINVLSPYFSHALDE